MSLTEWLPHLVPVKTRPGSRVSPCGSSSSWWRLYTCVPKHTIFFLSPETVVSIRTALFSIGLAAEAEHWILPHLASLTCIKIHTRSVNDSLECRWALRSSPVFATPVASLLIFAAVPVHVPSFIHLPKAQVRSWTSICVGKKEHSRKIQTCDVFPFGCSVSQRSPQRDNSR